VKKSADRHSLRGGFHALSEGIRLLFRKQAILILALTLVYLATALISSFVFDNKEFLFYVAAAPFLMAAVSLAHRRVDFPIELLWALSFLGLFHILGGFVPLPESVPAQGPQLLYNLWLIEGGLKFDQVVHAYGNGVATWLCWHLLRYSMSHVLKCEVYDIPAKPVFLVVCFLAGLGIGAFNEMGEFGTTRMVEKNNVGGYENTGWDLVANTVGGLIAVILIWFKRRKGRFVTDRRCRR
jgi:hypothetical protein